MELYRTTSLHKIDISNCLINLVYIFINSLIGIYAIGFIINLTKKLFEILIEKNLLKKGNFFLNLFSDTIFVLITFVELLLINYIIRITSFLIIREKIFEFVIFNFRTVSNNKDLRSYMEFYCHDYYRDNEENNSIALLNEIRFYICNFEILDKFYFEYFFSIIVSLYIFLENFLIYRKIRIRENIFSFYKKIFYLIIILQIAYFLFSFIGLYYLKIKSIESKVDYYSNNQVSHFNYYDRFENINTNKLNEILDDKNININFEKEEINDFNEFRPGVPPESLKDASEVE